MELVSLDCSGHRLKGMWIRLHAHEKGSDLDNDHGDHFFKGLMRLFFLKIWETSPTFVLMRL